LNDNDAAFFAAVEAFNISPDYEAALFEIGTALKNISTAESAQYIACVAQFYWDSFKEIIRRSILCLRSLLLFILLSTYLYSFQGTESLKNVWTATQLQELLKPKLVAQEQRLFKDSAPGSESLASPNEGIRPE